MIPKPEILKGEVKEEEIKKEFEKKLKDYNASIYESNAKADFWLWLESKLNESYEKGYADFILKQLNSEYHRNKLNENH